MMMIPPNFQQKPMVQQLEGPKSFSSILASCCCRRFPLRSPTNTKNPPQNGRCLRKRTDLPVDHPNPTCNPWSVPTANWCKFRQPLAFSSTVAVRTASTKCRLTCTVLYRQCSSADFDKEIKGVFFVISTLNTRLTNYIKQEDSTTRRGDVMGMEVDG